MRRKGQQHYVDLRKSFKKSNKSCAIARINFLYQKRTEHESEKSTKLLLTFKSEIKSNQISLFLTQLQLQQNELKLNTQNAQSREKSLIVTK